MMTQISPQMRILVAVEAVDFRKAIDGLARVCQEKLQSDDGRGFSLFAGAVCFLAGATSPSC
jgi:hypothetical protein